MSISDRLDAIEARPVAWPWLDRAADDKDAMLAALRAVLDLHKPEKFDDDELTCKGCDIGSLDPPTWPCQTVRTVTAALGEDS